VAFSMHKQFRSIVMGIVVKYLVRPKIHKNRKTPKEAWTASLS